MNIAAMVKRLGGKAYLVTRPNADGAYSTTDGTYSGTTTALQVQGLVQPARPEDLITLPEGDRTTEALWFYTAGTVLNEDVANLRRGDIVSAGFDYRVKSVEHWPGYSKALLLKVNTDAN